MAQPPILWQPTPKQAEFLAAAEDEVLFGGAAGGGKSDGLVVDALGLQQRAIAKPHYRAVLFRRSYPELRELIDRSRDLYPAISPGARYRDAEKAWQFTSGAKLIFSYIEAEADRYRHQGFEYQYVGWDELTHQATPVGYEYLRSRLRTPDPALHCYLRATTNPGGAGSQWVQAHWRIADDGAPTRFAVPVGGRTLWRRFIPSRLDDNPYLADSGYRERLMLLPELERRALLEGRWDVLDIPGAIFRAEIQAAFSAGRITQVPHDPALPVHTAWDLGMGDATAIWFAQVVGLEVRLIDYYAAQGEGLAHYAQVLQQRGYVYGEHLAPHDIEVRELGTGKSRLEVARRLGIRFRIVPRLGLEDGIQAARALFPRCWFDQQRCGPGLDGLRHYRRDYHQRLGEFKATPVHDWASHPADAFRYLALGLKQTAKPVAIAYPKHNYGVI